MEKGRPTGRHLAGRLPYGALVWRWRKALGVGRADPPGSKRLIQATAEAGGAAMHERGLTPEEAEVRRTRALELDLKRHLHPGYHGPRWTPAQKKLLGKLTNAEVAARIGRTVGAVRQKRNLAGIRTAWDCRQRAKLRRQGLQIKDDSV